MNIQKKHSSEKAVSTAPLFKGEAGTVTSLQILKDQQLKEHMTTIPALLVCVNGNAVFENEQGMKESLSTGDYVLIEPMVKHWVTGVSDSQLLLIK